MIYFPKLSSRNNKDIMVALIFVLLDEVGTSCHCFTLTELAKEPNPQGTIKVSTIFLFHFLSDPVHETKKLTCHKTHASKISIPKLLGAQFFT